MERDNKLCEDDTREFEFQLVVVLEEMVVEVETYK